MTEVSCADISREPIHNAPIGRLPAIARELGIGERDVGQMTMDEVRGYRSACYEKAGEYLDIVKRPALKKASLAELREDLKKRSEALDKLDAALIAANAQAPAVSPRSVLDLCEYIRTESRTVICTRPASHSLIEIFEMANAECARLGIKPAVYAGGLDWWKRNTSAAQNLAVTEDVAGFVEGSLDKNRRAQEKMAKNQGGMASIEMAALANVLEHIATRGAHDTFEKHWVRTKASGVVLRRDALGFFIRRLSDDRSGADVGCAASRNL